MKIATMLRLISSATKWGRIKVGVAERPGTRSPVGSNSRLFVVLPRLAPGALSYAGRSR